MLKITSRRARIGKRVSAKVKNEKDDMETILEFSFSNLGLTQTQLSALVACHPDERPFAQVAFVSKDAISELRHFKALPLAIEIDRATITIDRIKGAGDAVQLAGCRIKGITLNFNADERVEMAGKIWAKLEEHTLYQIGKCGALDVYMAIDAPAHGELEPSDNKNLHLTGGGPATH
jgi:hypothetical protein